MTRNLVLLVVWAVSAWYVGSRLDRGWFPPDDGILAHSAERVLQGETPHTDFDELYTGGLSYLNALGLKVFGTNLLALRLVLYLLFLAWVPAVYWIAIRFASPAIAGLATLFAVAWSLPSYMSPMPSWYNLFLATFGTAALLKHVETGQRRWLVAAGLCGGFSVIVKIAGVYFIVGALLFLAFREQLLSGAQNASLERRSRAYRLLLAGGLVLLTAGVLQTVRYAPAFSTFVHFGLPVAITAALLMRNEGTEPRGSLGQRVSGLLRLAAPFLGGALAPILFFALPYLWSGSLDDLYQGTFVLPARRLHAPRAGLLPVQWPLPSLASNVYIIPLLAMIVLAPRLRGRLRRYTVLGLALLLGALLTIGDSQPVYLGIWYSIRPLVPLTICSGVLLLWPRRSLAVTRPALQRQQVMLLLCITGLISLVQFPFAASTYFLYVAPLGLLAALSVVGLLGPAHQRVLALFISFFILFAVRWIHPAYTMYVPSPALELLRLERAGLRVSAQERDTYERLVRTVRALSSGAYIYATPDAPEVYFLTGFKNPTRTIVEMFDEADGRGARILSALEEKAVNVLVIQRLPAFSGLPPEEFRAALLRRYPRGTEIGRFAVLCRQCGP